MPGFPVLHHLLELAHAYVHQVGDAIQPSCPLSSPSPSAFILSQQQGLLNELALPIRGPKYWSFSFSPSNEYSGLISFRIDWFDLAVQGTVKSLLQHHSSTTSILQCSAFLIVQLSHPCMTIGKATGKTNSVLTIRTFVGKVMSLLFNTLSGFVTAFLPRRNIFHCQLICRSYCSLASLPSTVLSLVPGPT